MNPYKLFLTVLVSASLIASQAACRSHSEVEQSAALTLNPTIQPTVMPSPSPQPTVPPTPTEAPQPKPLYRMNDAYRFVPIEASTTDKAVLLTFDDGPNNEKVIKSLLDTLDKHKAKAIFFVNGYRVKKKPELLKLIYERGQTIGNHAWDHNSLKDAGNDLVKQQIGDVQDAVRQLTGEAPLFFRPPYGAGSDFVKQTAKDHGMLYMTWSNGSLDWEQPARDNPAEVIRNVMEQLHPGANILMHELQWTADALDELLTKLENEGYTFIDPAVIAVTPYT